MKPLITIVTALAVAATPLAAQERELIVGLYGGGADHLADLEKSPPAWFMPGWAAGASVGIQLNSWLAIRGDFTYTRNPIEGAEPLAGEDMNRFYFGVQAEYRYQATRDLAPFAFAGLGAVTIDQEGIDNFSPTTRPAILYGGGLLYSIPGSRLELVGTIKGATYRWNMAGFHRNMVDVIYTLGLSYRRPFAGL